MVYEFLPQPPRLHWGWLLVLSFLTGGVFGAVWMGIQASWARRVHGGNVTLALTGAYALLTTVLVLANLNAPFTGAPSWAGGYTGLLSGVLWIASVYLLRGELAAEPIGLSLGWIMPLVFGPLYFQYHLTNWGAESSSGRPLGL